jgi:hypothetical protein
MALRNVRDAVDAENNGQTFYSAWRKTPTQTTGAGIWFDLSMSPGNPVPNYYAAAPNVAIALRQSTDGGIPHGGNVAQLGMTKYLKTFMAMTVTAAAVPLPMLLCDYLLFYPFVDMSVTDIQVFDNTVPLPRYQTSKRLQIMAVEVAGQTGVGNPRFQVGYTNSNGVSGRMTPLVACNTQQVNGTIINSQSVDVVGARAATGPFLALQPGDTGVQSIDSIQFQSPDIGLIALVIVEVVENISIRTIDAPMERNTFVDSADRPIIADDAYLGLVCCPNGNLSGAPIHGIIQTIWG